MFVYHVVANDVAVAAFLELDAVALRDGRPVRVMDIVAFDEAVRDPAPIAVAAEVHAFACTVRVMNVVCAAVSGPSYAPPEFAESATSPVS